MTGQEIFDQAIKKRDEYSSVLMVAYEAIGENLFPMLEQAESEGKKIVLLPSIPYEDGPSEPYPTIG